MVERFQMYFLLDMPPKTLTNLNYHVPAKWGKKQKASVIQIVSDQQYKVCEMCIIYSSEEKGKTDHIHWSSKSLQ